MKKINQLLFGLLLVVPLLLSATVNSLAAKRIALVIGNDDYAQINDLQKAANDADAMAATLEGIGYEVLLARDVTRREMNRQIQQFASRLEPGDEALFYYAGHGVEIAGRNYLLPTDIPRAGAGQEDFITSEAIPVDIVLDRIRSRGTRVSILILDACRDNPFPKKGTRSLGGSRGLTRSIAPEGTFIMYSAGVSQTALDRLSDDDSNPNSVFTRSLIPLLKQPGMSLTQTARQVRRDVQKLASTVSHAQRPAYYDEVTGEFFFAGRADTSQAKPATKPNQADPAVQAWATIQNTNSQAILKTFIERFSNSLYADFAKARLKELQEKQIAVIVPPDASKPEQFTRAPVDECDRLAAHPNDLQAVAPGVLIENMNVRLAKSACRDAMARFPSEKRFSFQFARARSAAKEYDEAYSIQKQLAEDGYPAAIYVLGVFHTTGQVGEIDHGTALHWYRKASEAGSAIAMTSIAFSYQEGLGVEANSVESFRWYRKAAEAGDLRAMAALGRSYYFGIGTKENKVEAAKWLARAADADHPASTRHLGYMYAKGEGVTKNDATAIELYQKAAKQGDAVAMANLGDRYYSARGVKKDREQAIAYWKKAVDLGVASSKNNLALVYYAKGKPAEQNHSKAALLLLEAYEEGYEQTVTNLEKNSKSVIPAPTRSAIQRQLSDKGYYSGKIDGDFGPGSIKALKAFAAAKR